MNISPEAREAAEEWMMGRTNQALAQHLQALIDQTIERCAVVADVEKDQWVPGEAATHYGKAYQRGCSNAATAIRSLKSNTDGGGGE